ncbi:MAG: gluconeogenesis factor YvcK family protein [Candidatus Caenarcaniphilales bacterium]|nr:gluconeogenesis factor YvcK family protein [Candidatus Caenarcaniphilales bacterium]
MSAFLPKLPPLPRSSSRYFLPGIKRWILIFMLGLVLVIFGVALLLELRPFTAISSFIWRAIRSIAQAMPAHISGPLILIAGAGLILGAISLAIRTMFEATIRDNSTINTASPTSQTILKALERAHRRGQGPKIVAIGGGTGLSTLLRGLKNYSSNICAIVTVGDDGGSSGRLREELNVVPPGDIRNCIVALSDEEEVTTSLFQHRFQLGSLKGHSLGNLFLAALCDICGGDMSKATQVASRILRSGGKVLPSSLEAVQLCAEFEDGSILEGESKIPEAGKKIKRIFMSRSIPALPEILTEIQEAELLILGPGSLYTSVIPNLLFPEITQAIRISKARKLYICNLVQDKETQGYSLKDFIRALEDHAGGKLIEAALLNEPQSWQLGFGKPVPITSSDINSFPYLDIVVRPRLHDETGRHNPLRLARSIMQWFHQKQRQTGAVLRLETKLAAG